MSLGKKLITTSLWFVLIATLQSISLAKSVYVISDTGTWTTDVPLIQAYAVVGSTLALQTSYNSAYPHAIGTSIASDSEFMFISHEGFPQNPGNKIEIVNTKTMQYVDTVIAPGATDLAGIVMDAGKSKLYSIDRYRDHLYSWSWNPATMILSPDFDDPYYILLDDCYEGFGIALDEVHHRLYVADNTDVIKFYDTNDPDWPKRGQISVSCNVISVAIDVDNQLLYYGSMGTYGQGDPYLYQYDLTDPNNNNSVNVGCSVAGIAVDQQTSLVYLTTYGDSGDTYYPNPPKDRLMVYDANLTQLWVSDDIGNPSGVAIAADVSYKDPFPALTLVKEDDVAGCVSPYDKIVYTISYEANGDSDSNVEITDYLPVGVEPNDPCDPQYNSELHRYTWQIGELSGGASDFVTLEVVVNGYAEPLGTITNYCEIEGDQYCSFTAIDINVCCWGGDIIYVDESAVGRLNIGTSWENAYLDLQDALTRANNGCGSRIWVAAGTYKPTEDEYDPDAAFEMVEGVSMYGGFPPGGGQRNPAVYQTILSGDIDGDGTSANNSNYVVNCENISGAVLDGFTVKDGDDAGIKIDNASVIIRNSNITENNREGIECINQSSADITNCQIQNNGDRGISCSGGSFSIMSCAINGNGNSYNDDGAGIYNNGCLSLTIENCTFNGNKGDSGGGLYNCNSSPTIENCTFSSNSSICGGGMYNDSSDPYIINCNFTGNTAVQRGGGVYNTGSSSPTIVNCNFSENRATSTTYTGCAGGGMYNNSSNPSVTNCIFSGNTAVRYGGGMYNYSSNPSVTNCIFSGNTAVRFGGGMYNYSSNPSLTNCIFYKNEAGDYSSSAGGGISNENSSPALINCTFVGNSAKATGGGVDNFDGCSPTITNCIFWDNDAPAYSEIHDDSLSHSTVSYCDIQGGCPSGTNIMDAYPCFYDPDNDNYHIIPDSPCIDAGDPGFNPTNETDIDGEPRIADGRVDMGADEYYWSPADFDENEIVNFIDYAMLADAWQTDDPEFNLDGVGNVDYEDLDLFCDDWLWTPAWYQSMPAKFLAMGAGMDRGVIESVSLVKVTEPSVQIERISPVPAPYIDRKKVILDLLDELWLRPEVREALPEEDWLKFVESIKSTLE